MSSALSCPLCRREFNYSEQAHEHVESVCWFTNHQRKHPEKWASPLRDYVWQALDPRNSIDGWAREDIISVLKSMIEGTHYLTKTSSLRPEWENMPLPQQIDPKHFPLRLDLKHELGGGGKSDVAASDTAITRKYPEVFSVQNSTPRSLFRHAHGMHFTGNRYPGEILVYAGGACNKDGTQAGCAFVFSCSDGIPLPWNVPKGAYCMHGALFFRLEDVGPQGAVGSPTLVRAKLRAATAALHDNNLGMCLWDPNKAASLVIATDSTYVIHGATKWCQVWEANEWKLENGDPVENCDLWQLLLERVRQLYTNSKRCKKVSFWLITRQLNRDASLLAKSAVNLPRRSAFGVPLEGNLPVMLDASQLE